MINKFSTNAALKEL